MFKNLKEKPYEQEDKSRKFLNIITNVTDTLSLYSLFFTAAVMAAASDLR
jgi:hypothetical protein